MRKRRLPTRNSVFRIPLVAPCITDTDRREMSNAVSLGLLKHGLSEVERFEETFADRVGARWAVAVNSGSSALIVALKMLGIDKARVPSWSCVAVRNAAMARGLPIEYVDTHFDVRQAFATLRGEADVVTHMFGRPTEIPYPAARFVEDFTLSLGGITGLIGDLGVCSTHESKMISTGCGGVIFGDDDDLHQQALELVHYDRHTSFGFSVAMTAMQACLGRSQLAQLDDFIYRRRDLATRYTRAFQRAGIACPDVGTGSVFFRYLVAVESPDDAVAALADRGIEAGRGVYPALHQLAWLPDSHFPGTSASVNSLVSLPVHPSITDAEAVHVVESVLEVCAP
jgi:perosamine synthetase